MFWTVEYGPNPGTNCRFKRSRTSLNRLNVQLSEIVPVIVPMRSINELGMHIDHVESHSECSLNFVTYKFRRKTWSLQICRYRALPTEIVLSWSNCEIEICLSEIVAFLVINTCSWLLITNWLLPIHGWFSQLLPHTQFYLVLTLLFSKEPFTYYVTLLRGEGGFLKIVIVGDGEEGK